MVVALLFSLVVAVVAAMVVIYMEVSVAAGTAEQLAVGAIDCIFVLLPVDLGPEEDEDADNNSY
jgi:hypothetical protein